MCGCAGADDIALVRRANELKRRAQASVILTLQVGFPAP